MSHPVVRNEEKNSTHCHLHGKDRSGNSQDQDVSGAFCPYGHLSGTTEVEIGVEPIHSEGL